MRQIEINSILQAMLSFKPSTSDLHFYVGRPPQVEVDGLLVPVPFPNLEKLSPFHVEKIAFSMMGNDEDSLRKFITTGSTEFSYSLSGSCRFRVAVYQQRGSLAIVMRVIPFGIPDIKSLGLPENLLQIGDEKNGIVLVTGPTGSGKSTTIASIINEINQKYAYHIITIEDPVEYMHRHTMSSICQRELGSDTNSFSGALRAALRQSPKVIVVGEMRDLETTEIALEAAETGHLVLSTLHTIDAAKTIERILGIFPPTEEQHIRVRFAQAFKWVISQKLIPRKGGGRVPTVEVLKSTMRTREYIIKGNIEGKSLLDAMQDGSLEGMQTFDKDLERLVRKGIVTKEVALSYATNANNLLIALQGRAEEGDAATIFVDLLQKEHLQPDDILKVPEAMQAVIDTANPEEIDHLFKKVFGYLNTGEADEKVAVISAIPAISLTLSQKEKWKNIDVSIVMLVNRYFNKEADPEVVPMYLNLVFGWFRKRFQAKNFAGAQEMLNTIRVQAEKSDRLKKQLAQGVEPLQEILKSEIQAGSEGVDVSIEFLKLCGLKGAEFLIEMLVDEEERSVRLRLLNYIAQLDPDAVAPQIERRLTDYRWYVVRNMMTILTKVNIKGYSAMLQKVMDHQEPRVIKEILRKLFQSSSPADAPVVLHLLQHPEKTIRIQAIHVAGMINLESSVPSIVKMASSNLADDTDLRASCLQTLLKIGSREAVPLAKAVLEKKSSSKTDVAERNAAVKVLGEMSKQAFHPLLEKIASSDSNQETRTLASSYL